MFKGKAERLSRIIFLGIKIKIQTKESKRKSGENTWKLKISKRAEISKDFKEGGKHLQNKSQNRRTRAR